MTRARDNSNILGTSGTNGQVLTIDTAQNNGYAFENPAQFVAGKNAVINGAMEISQRNGISAVTPASGYAGQQIYVLDRFVYTSGQISSAMTFQQVTDAPTGFVYSLKSTVASAVTSPSSTDDYGLAQFIEGSQVAAYNLGTSSAATATLSFWAKSSLTGNFTISLQNNAYNRTFVTTYNITTANTWQKISITFAGDTAGTWVRDTSGAGLRVVWNLGTGSGSTTSTTNTWQGAYYSHITGSNNLISTAGATLYITGAQLELGSVATPFSRAGGTLQGELSACERYYQLIASGTGKCFGTGNYFGSGQVHGLIPLRTTMRTVPTSASVVGTGYYKVYSNGSTTNLLNSITLGSESNERVILLFNNTEASGTQGTGLMLITNNAASFIALQAEL
jgi:hypothetical protein